MIKYDELKNKILEYISDCSDRLIYVVGKEDYCLYYMNKKTMKLTGYADDSYVGEKCYKVLQGKDSPCEFCTNLFLKEGETYEWEYYNSNFNRYFNLKDLFIEHDGRKLRIEYAKDITDEKEHLNQLEFSLKLEKAQLNCLKTFQFEKDINVAINKFLEIVCRFYGAARSYMFEFDYQKNILNYTYEWCSEGETPEIDNFSEIPLEYAKEWIVEFNRRGEFGISNMDNYSENNSEAHKILEAQGIDSLLAAPFYQNNILIGFLGVDNPRVYSKNFVLLKATSFFINEELEKKRQEKVKTFMAYNDSLTKVYNRNKFTETVADIQSNNYKFIGIAYADINGLKHINDTKGHEEGDRLILNAAGLLRNVFEDNVYRIGGDEFVILLVDVDQDVFSEKMLELERVLHSSTNVKLALGSVWVEQPYDIEHYLRIADKSMYENKQNYYRTIRDNKIEFIDKSNRF